MLYLGINSFFLKILIILVDVVLQIIHVYCYTYKFPEAGGDTSHIFLLNILIELCDGCTNCNITSANE